MSEDDDFVINRASFFYLNFGSSQSQVHQHLVFE